MPNDLEKVARELIIELGNLKSVGRGLESAGAEWAAKLGAALDDGSVSPTIIDRIAEMPLNHTPTHKDFVRCFGSNAFWPVRGQSSRVWNTARNMFVSMAMPEKITGVTIHHTIGHSPLATARYCTSSKGYPTTQYHYWVSADDGCPIYRLVDESVAVWHDHTGTFQTALAVGLAGRWDYAKPSDEQLEAAARLVAWLFEKHGIDDVAGHCDRAASGVTVCPGWHRGGWRDRFFGILATI